MIIFLLTVWEGEVGKLREDLDRCQMVSMTSLRLDIRHLRKIDSACSNVIISYILIDISLEIIIFVASNRIIIGYAV